MTDTDRFRACGEALFGTTWQTELAHALELSVKVGLFGRWRQAAHGSRHGLGAIWRS